MASPLKNPLVKNVLLFCLGLALAGVIGLFIKREPIYVQETKDYSPRTTGDINAYLRDCVGVNAPPEPCRSAGAIKSSYGVDIWRLLEIEQGRTVMTARWIADGTLEEVKDYDSCIAKKLCRPVPLPPQQARHDEKILNAPENVRIMKVFRHLVDDGSLTPETCDVIAVCRAMVKAGLLKPDGNGLKRTGENDAAGR